MRKPRSPAPAPLDSIYSGRQPRRPHFIAEWMEHRGIKTQAELAAEIDADKSLVSRWLDEEKPTSPSKEYQDKLGAFFGGEGEPVDIFRHPLDDWFVKFFRDKTVDQMERGRRLLEAAFPPDDPSRKASNRS